MLEFNEEEIVEYIVKYYKQFKGIDVLVSLKPKRTAIGLGMLLTADISYVMRFPNRVVNYIETISMVDIKEIFSLMLEEKNKITSIEVDCDKVPKMPIGEIPEYTLEFKGLIINKYQKGKNNLLVRKRRKNQE